MRFRRIAVVAATAALVAAGVTVPALAANAGGGWRDGGFWDYGKQGGEIYSNYHHGSKYHSATACDYDLFNPCQRVMSAPGGWAYAHVPDRWFGVDDAFWATY
jgi:lactococcin 972 family bacteriocin